MKLCLCPVCRKHDVLTKDPTFAPLHAFFSRGQPVVTGGIYRPCEACQAIFLAGHENCRGHLGAIQPRCEQCAEVEHFWCPNPHASDGHDEPELLFRHDLEPLKAC